MPASEYDPSSFLGIQHCCEPGSSHRISEGLCSCGIPRGRGSCKGKKSAVAMPNFTPINY